MAAAAGLGVLLETTAAAAKQKLLLMRPAAAPPARTTPAQIISKATLNAAAKNDDATNDNTSAACAFSCSPCASRAPMAAACSFLKRCFLCRRELADGRDIYIYRGDRAFCSEDCRCRHILVEDDDDDGAVDCARAGFAV